MSKKKKANSFKPDTSALTNSNAVTNNLASGLFGGFSGVGFGSPFGTQVSATDTLLLENRYNLVTNNRQLLSQSYVEIGLIKTIVSVPVEDALRGGLEIISSDLDPEDIKRLQKKMRREKDLKVVGQALKWARLFGGGGIVIVNGDEHNTELDINTIKVGDRVSFRAVDMWELYFNYFSTFDNTTKLETDIDKDEVFNFYGKELHASRVLKVLGETAPSLVKQRVYGWGLSIVEALVRSINQYLKATNVTFEVLDEFKIDVYKIKGLAATLMSSGGSEKIHRRIQLANQEKNFQSAITMDGEDDYIQKQLQFTGMAEVMEGIRMQVASDLRIPLTKLFGVSSAGFNSGEDDIENYNSMIESEIRTNIEFEVLKMVEIRCMQLFGFIPDDLEVNFKPLRVLSTEQEENVKTAKFNRAAQARQMGEISSEEFKESLNADNLLGVQVEVNDELYETPDTDMSEGGVVGKAEPGGTTTESTKLSKPTDDAK